MKVTTCSKRPILEPCGLENLNYQIDPYVGCGHYCRYCYALARAETDWREEVRIHGDIVGQLRRELESVEPQIIYMGYNTDPYQPVEAEQLQTRKVLELFMETGHSVSFLTKSDLFVRDLDLLTRMMEARASISAAFTVDEVREQFEYNTTPTHKRMAALKRAREAGLKTSALLCPIIPHITDVMTLVEQLAPITDTIWIYGLNISDRGGLNWKNMEAILGRYFPNRKDRVVEAVFDREHAYWKELRSRLEALRQEGMPELRIHI
ncbi:SPL family radical SAM protein [Salidesulfovibrio onnuriiensis]|uniref:SPL family radical SAM protein n=1 Tax=Salidesulfovibrio onnuriiensis TaxID=2583823 RepID=UPI00165000FA|nr:radical SAM protein [Salidesulfovibrio onnuriiensis]